MPAKAVIFQNFSGNWSTDTHLGIKYSAPYVQGFNVRDFPSQLTVGPTLAQTGDGEVVDLIQGFVGLPDGITVYGLGDRGYVYRYDSDWHAEGKISASGGGLDYRYDTDQIFLTGTKTVSAINNVTSLFGSPTLQPDLYGPSFSTYNNSTNAGFNVSAYQVGSSSTTLIPTAINESEDNRRAFQVDVDPLNKISGFVVSKGTGDWTLTLHDGLNHVLGQATIPNASLVNESWNDFYFTSSPNAQVRVSPYPNARTYHLHLTSTVADGTTSSSIKNTLSSCDLMIWADRMVYGAIHPITRFLQYELIGNGNYLSVWEPLSTVPTNAEWLRQGLVFPSNLTVTGLATQNEYVVVAATDSITDSSILFFWDGVTQTQDTQLFAYNYSVAIPEGAVYGLTTYQNVVYYFAGGAWWALPGASTTPIKLRTMPGFQNIPGGNGSFVPYQGGAVVNGIHHLAYNVVGDFKPGVYSWGAVDKNYPPAFGFELAPSRQNTNRTDEFSVTLGTITPLSAGTFVSWREDRGVLSTLYGVDVQSWPAPLSIYESLVIDNGYRAREKLALFMEASFYQMEEGDAIRLKYRLSPEDEWTYSEEYTLSNLWQGQDHYARLNIPSDARFYEAQVGVEMTTTTIIGRTSAQAPYVSLVSFIYDDLKSEVIQ